MVPFAAGDTNNAADFHRRGKQSMSRLQIPIPAELYLDNGYPHEEALFGIPKYGGTIAEVGNG